MKRRRRINKNKFNPNFNPIKTMQKHGATLSGTVNPKSGDTTEEAIAQFEYGFDTDYGMVVPLTNIPAGNDPVPVTADITDLEPETIYHFRLVASNGLGLTESEDKVFTTLADIIVGHTAPEVVVNEATNIS
jgi:hypothetical protein